MKRIFFIIQSIIIIGLFVTLMITNNIVAFSSAVGTADDQIDSISGEARPRTYFKLDPNLSENVSFLLLAKEALGDQYTILNKEIISLEEKEYKYEYMEITKATTDSEFVWKNNNNKRLNRQIHYIADIPSEIDRSDSHKHKSLQLGELITVSVFESMDNDGIIILLHSPPALVSGCAAHKIKNCTSRTIERRFACSRYGLNYLEFHLVEEGKLMAYAGQTDPFPFPMRDECT